jgi:hypothetical protein
MVLCLATACLICLTACAAFTATATPKGESVDTNVYLIRESTQLNLNGLKIAAGNLMRSEYQDEEGTITEGVTAMLWVVEDDGLSQRVRVYAGQEVVVGHHLIGVVEVSSDSQGGFVRLTVTPAQESEP